MTTAVLLGPYSRRDLTAASCYHIPLQASHPLHLSSSTRPGCFRALHEDLVFPDLRLHFDRDDPDADVCICIDLISLLVIETVNIGG